MDNCRAMPLCNHFVVWWIDHTSRFPPKVTSHYEQLEQLHPVPKRSYSVAIAFGRRYASVRFRDASSVDSFAWRWPHGQTAVLRGDEASLPPLPLPFLGRLASWQQSKSSILLAEIPPYKTAKCGFGEASASHHEHGKKSSLKILQKQPLLATLEFPDKAG